MSCTPDELKKKINACESNPKSTSKGKTALEACKEMEEKEKTIGDALNAIANTPAKLMDAFKAKNEAVQKTVSDLGITIDTKQITEQSNSCSNEINKNFSNTSIIRGCPVPEALNNCGSMCNVKDFAGNTAAYGMCMESQKDCYDQLNKWTALQVKQPSNIKLDQKISDRSSQKCMMQAVTKAVSEQEASIENEAFLKAMQKATGLMSDNKSEQSACSNIDINQSSCQYVNQKNCCANKAEVTAENVSDLEICAPLNYDVKQHIETVTEQMCELGASADLSSAQKAGIKNKTSMATDQTATGLDLTGLLLGALLIPLIIIGVALIGVPLAVKLMGIPVMLCIGFALLALGGYALVYYFTKLPADSSNANSPFLKLNNKDSIAIKSKPGSDKTIVNTTFEQALKYWNKNKLRENDPVVAFDFFSVQQPDKVETEGTANPQPTKSIDGNWVFQPNQSGYAIYYSYVNPKKRNGMECRTGQTEETMHLCTDPSVSYLVGEREKESEKMKWLYGGGGVAGLGLILFIVGIVQVIGRKKAAAETPAAKTPVEKFNFNKNARSKSSNCKSNSRNARFNRGSRRNH